MIDNEYVFETNLELDVAYLSKLKNKTAFLKDHQNIVGDDPYLQSIQKQFPFLSTVWNVYDVSRFTKLMPHVDAQRKAALNIPLFGSDGSTTSFYKNSNDYEYVYDDSKILHWVHGQLAPDFSFTLLRPTLINNSAIHSMTNGSNRRAILSWSVVEGISFEEAKQLLKESLNV